MIEGGHEPYPLRTRLACLADAVAAGVLIGLGGGSQPNPVFCRYAAMRDGLGAFSAVVMISSFLLTGYLMAGIAGCVP